MAALKAWLEGAKTAVEGWGVGGQRAGHGKALRCLGSHARPAGVHDEGASQPRTRDLLPRDRRQVGLPQRVGKAHKLQGLGAVCVGASGHTGGAFVPSSKLQAGPAAARSMPAGFPR